MDIPLHPQTSLHQGHIVLKAQEDLCKEIERQLDMEVDSVAAEDKWMLEVDVQQLASYSLVQNNTEYIRLRRRDKSAPVQWSYLKGQPINGTTL